MIRRRNIKNFTMNIKHLEEIPNYIDFEIEKYGNDSFKNDNHKSYTLDDYMVMITNGDHCVNTLKSILKHKPVTKLSNKSRTTVLIMCWIGYFFHSNPIIFNENTCLATICQCCNNDSVNEFATNTNVTIDEIMKYVSSK